MSGPSTPDGHMGHKGFGLIEEEDLTVLPSDRSAAALLKAAVDTLPPRKTGATQARPSSWPRHFRLLRVRDGVVAGDISRVVVWYAGNIGKEFVPLAFSGEAFRKKFHAIERQCDRDISAVEVGPQAAMVAKHLATLGWPKGTEKALPGAVQTCLAAYEAWTTRRGAFTEQLRRDDLIEDYGAERQRLLGLAKHLRRVMPAPGHFVQEWMTMVHRRVKGWAEWSGDFASLVFKADSAHFLTMGRGWADDFAHNPDRFDRFVEVMKKESV